jgi:peptidoglycan/LPS O-acetylase OafA/YrhL
MSAYWFRPKQYGYGAAPVTWQGWALTLGTLAVVIAATVMMSTHSATDAVFWLAVVVEVAAVMGLVVVSRRKTEGGWRWRWGDR